MNRVTGKRIGSMMLRKIAVSDKEDKGMTPKERADLAKQMGHSINQQVMTYSRFVGKNKTDLDNEDVKAIMMDIISKHGDQLKDETLNELIVALF